MVAIYSFAVPVRVLTFMGITEVFRFSSYAPKVTFEVGCNTHTDYSKWAAPDIFAYIMLIFLIRRWH